MIEIEKTILSEILSNNKILDDIRQILSVEMFQDNKNRLIYKTFLDLQDEGKPIDVITVYENLKRNDCVDFVGGLDYINELIGISSSVANFIYHCKILLEGWMKLELCTLAKEIQERCLDERDVFEIISYITNKIYEVENNIKIGKDRDLYSELMPFIDNLEKKLKGEIPEGLKCTSFPSFNIATGGIMPSDYIIIYGEDKQGKTSVSERILLDMAFQGIPVGIFSLEMDFDSVMSKSLSFETGIDYLKLRNPKGMGATEYELKQFAKDAMKFKTTKIFIDDKTFDFDRIIGKMRLWKRKYNVGMFCIDYIGLAESIKKFKEKRFEIADFSRRIKQTGKELNTPIIAISQANEKEQTAEAKSPLRDCDFALFCIKPTEKGIKSIKNTYDEDFIFNENHFLVTMQRSRHGRNKQNFVAGYVNNNFIEIDIDGRNKTTVAHWNNQEQEEIF